MPPPILFTSAAVTSSHLMIRVEEYGAFGGWYDFQFVDDIIFLSIDSSRQLECLKLLLLVCGWCFLLKVKLNRSTLSGVNVNESSLKGLVDLLECEVQNELLGSLKSKDFQNFVVVI